MKFEVYLNEAWAAHAKDAQKVADTFLQAFLRLESNEQIPPFVALITHVMGEHLAQFQEGIIHLENLRQHEFFQADSESENSISCLIAILKVAAGDVAALPSFSTSEQIRILAVAASAICLSQTIRAMALFEQALGLAEKGLEEADPANRSLAVTGNNLANTLEETKDRSPEQTEFMILAAKTGRKFWGIAGTWLQQERAEYRLVQSYLQAAKPDIALQHANNCLQICEENKAEALEFYFGFHALALAQKALGHEQDFHSALEKMKSYFALLSEDDKKWCEASLTELA